MNKKYYLAIDIGASSGRHMIGDESGTVTELFRFETGFYNEDGHMFNDVEKLWKNVREGIKIAFAKYPQIESISIDTWGVDYVLMNGDEEILPVYSYRDCRTENVIPEMHKMVSFERLYERTGIQFQPFNTLYQLYADKVAGRLKNATDFLMLPEWLSYKLTGVKKHEYTNATTGGFVDQNTGDYDRNIISAFDLPIRLFGKLDLPGTEVGTLLPEVSAYVGGQTKVVLCASHDTASAVEGIPIEGDQPYISSGTWSLLGVKVKKAITDEDSRKANYSNEGGVGYTRYQKNIMGMWIVNNLKKELCPDLPFKEIDAQAFASEFNDYVDVNDNLFLAPVSMKEAFDTWFEHEERKPKTIGDYFKCAYLSLAIGYMVALKELEKNTGKHYERLYIVGGGAKNKQLNQLTEQICGIKVVALPIEATALGNLKIQMEANK